MAFKILSCDGGGIRGLITAMLISDLDKKTGFLAKTDGFAGTSTGGLIALSLANNAPINDLVNLYRTKGKDIFQSNGWISPNNDGAPSENEVMSPGKFSCQYKNDGLIKLANNLLGEGLLRDSKKFALVNTAQLWGDDNNSLEAMNKNQKSWLPRTFSSENEFNGVKLVDAALATSAAPTYFPPYNIEGMDYFADGGVFANNPSMVAIGEAISSGSATSLSDIIILSLGTGKVRQGISPDVFKKYSPLSWGASKWLWPSAFDGVPSLALLNLTLDTTAELAAIQVGQLLGKNYCRANVVLKDEYPLDDWKNIEVLASITDTYMASSEEWENTVSWVQKTWL